MKKIPADKRQIKKISYIESMIPAITSPNLQLTFSNLNKAYFR